MKTLLAAAAIVLMTTAAHALVIDMPQTCTGVLTMSDEGVEDKDGYSIDARKLEHDPRNKSLHCDIAVLSGKELRKVLKVCQNGDRCLIKGAFSGHGNFGWTKIEKVTRLSRPSCASAHSADGQLALRNGPGTHHAAIAQLQNGDLVEIKSADGNWRYVAAVVTTSPNTAEQMHGWVYAPLLKRRDCPEC